ncbi:MAG: TIGR04076 family protein [Chloroflexia bacterium]
MPYPIVARVKEVRGQCAFGHQVGDEILFDGESVKGRVCLSALYSFLPKVFAMRYGAQFPWLTDPDVALHACPDPANPVVFEIVRLREAMPGEQGNLPL